MKILSQEESLNFKMIPMMSSLFIWNGESRDQFSDKTKRTFNKTAIERKYLYRNNNWEKKPPISRFFQTKITQVPCKKQILRLPSHAHGKYCLRKRFPHWDQRSSLKLVMWFLLNRWKMLMWKVDFFNVQYQITMKLINYNDWIRNILIIQLAFYYKNLQVQNQSILYYNDIWANTQKTTHPVLYSHTHNAKNLRTFMVPSTPESAKTRQRNFKIAQSVKTKWSNLPLVTMDILFVAHVPSNFWLNKRKD